MNPTFVTRTVYYGGTTFFSAVVAIICLFNSIAERNHMASIAYLVIMAASAIIAVASVMYMCRSQDGADDDVDLNVVGLPFGKRYFYLGMLGLAAWRVIEGFALVGGHFGSALWGIIWIVAGLAVVGFSWSNFKSYTKIHPAT